MGSKADSRQRDQDLFEAELALTVEIDEDSNQFYGGVLREEDKKGNLTYRQLIFRQLVRKAASGDSKALQDVTDRILGKTALVTENKNMSMSYTEYLQDLEKQEELLSIEEAEFLLADPKESDLFE